MIFRHFFLVLASIAGLLCAPWSTFAAPRNPPKQPSPAKAAATDDMLLRAFDAYRAGDAKNLARATAAVQAAAPTHPLLAYLEYWRLRMRLEEQPVADLRAFLTAEQGSYLAERLRSDWLKELGKRGDWENFDRELPLLGQDDLDVRCFGWQSRLARGDEGVFGEAKDMWLEPRELPESCAALAEKMMAAEKLAVADVWRRARVLLENGQIAPARRALGYLPAGEKHDEALLNQAASTPARVVANPPKSLDKRATREMLLFAVSRLARGEPDAAAEALRGKLGQRLAADDLKYLWGRVAYEGARRLNPEAQNWYALAGDAAMNDEQLAWKVRAALRAARWQDVRDAIDGMSLTARQDPAWIYWYGRALGAQGTADGARAYYLRITGQPNFYGLLAAEELGYMVAVPEPFHAPTEAEVEAARKTPGLQRALALYRLDLRVDATREWIFTIRGMDDAQLLAAAEVAQRAAIFDRAINTADRTQHRHNYKVRFLAPFREQFTQHAQQQTLEEAWVLGLVRQESRFIPNARSSVGAKGLMQLMPATASWMAKRMGMRDFSQERVIDVPMNIALGSGYLRQVLNELGHPVLASAAYNAGPGRARRWRDSRPLEGAIYAETIPFNETRDYVKKVMANTMYYAQVIGGKLVPLKERMGQIPPRNNGERVNEDIP
jgi:soluble lytic murein transglycosylase